MMKFSTFSDITFDWLSLLGWSKTWAHPVVQAITEKLNLLICYLPSSFSSSFSSRSFSIDSMKELVALSFCFLLIIKILQIVNQCQKKERKYIITHSIVPENIHIFPYISRNDNKASNISFNVMVFQNRHPAGKFQ